MEKKNIATLSIAYVIAHLVFMPTYEVDKGFYGIEKKIGGVSISVRLTGAYRESNSRIINIANEEGPYFMQTSITTLNNQYYGAAFDNIFLIDLKTKNKITVLETPLPIEAFRTYSGMSPIVGFASIYDTEKQQGSIYINHNDHLVKVKFRVCNGNKCETLEFEEQLKYRVKRKFYSNSFANMMGI